MLQKFLLLFIFVTSSMFGSKLPDINSSEVAEILGQMMEAHVSCKFLTPSIVQRALEKYLEELDATKTYFLYNEVALWTDPSEDLLAEICESMNRGDFSHYNQIHKAMLPAIERRKRFEEQLESAPLPENVNVSEFKELDWVKTEDELFNRLLRIKSLQVAAAHKLDEEFQEKVLLRIAKRRTVREEELCSLDENIQQKLILTTVLKAFASSFDAHTSYFTPVEASQFMIQVQQRLFGIGAQLRDDLNGFSVVKIIEGGPATRDTGLKANDRIIAIDSEPVVGYEITEAVELIRGEEGTRVNLTVLRPTSEGEEKLEIAITRGEVVIQEARIESKVVPFGDGVIAHISLHAFYQDPQRCSSADLYDEINKIQEEHTLKGIVLDLRSNAGGVLPQAVAVSGLFITKGIVCSIKDNNGNLEHLRDLDGKTAYDGPLVILTSKASASAAEIVAQTLQDYGRAIVVGDEHTYGKGSFQTFTLDASNHTKVNPKGEFKVTRGKYYTVSGKSPQLVGVKPDILVPGIYSEAEIGEKYAKFALDNDSIKENFHDDLSDIPVVQRDQISWLYRFNLQAKIKTFTRHLTTLKKNSEMRVNQDLTYQNFLEILQKDEIESEEIAFYSKNDPQLHESFNIMKDLIVLLK